ncbi:MAG TPA: hypothetical protein P5268_00935 [Candidatus Marinimicrobia bacterium]|nr:hypothetical protein [Candidatus Neomarinimicrobiota bacterium]HRU91578.1 hypothetical protein [Candidatus Neomarinimicrobiota bacterium]
MKRLSKLSPLIFILIWNCTIKAQFKFEREIVPQAVREGVQFNAIGVNEFGDIYLLESKFSEVYRLDQNGNILNRNGGFGWGLGQFDCPRDLCVSGLDIIVADQNNHRLVRYDRQLNYIATQDLRSDSRRLIYPLSLTALQINELFILSGETAEILRLYVENNEQTWFGGIEYGAYALVHPVSLRMNRKGILTVLQENGSLVQFDRFGTPLGLIPFRDSEMNKCQAYGLTAVNNDWLILIDKIPFLHMFYTKSKNWVEPTLADFDRHEPFVAATFSNNRLYLLTSNGTILVFSIATSQSKP